MKRTFLAVLVFALSVSLSAQEKKDWGYVTGSLESNNNVYVEDAVNSTKAIKETVSNHIELDTSLTSNKKGFSYFHELFVIRHKKILTDAIRTQSIVIVVIIAIIIVFSFTSNFDNSFDQLS